MTKRSYRLPGPVVHLQGVQDARAVCGVDWMGQQLLAVSWQQRDRATCKKCLRDARDLINRLESP